MTPKRPRDPNQLAKSIIDIATGQTAEPGAALHNVRSAQQFWLNRRPFLGEERKTSARDECFSV